MTNPLEKYVVRIWKKEKIVGAGFLVGESQILTCAHVVRDALNLKITPHEPPQDDVYLDFPFIEWEKKVPARVVVWGPALQGEKCVRDIAGLELMLYRPNGSYPAQLGLDATVDIFRENKFCAFGFPRGYDNGAYAYGIVKDRRPDGLVQLEDEKVTGKAVEKGFSGGPAVDDNELKVLGMIATADKQPGTKVSFMIPIQTIVDVWPELKQKKIKTEHNEISVPIVVVAMTKNEAEDLILNSDIRGDLKSFGKFTKIFSEKDIEQWLSQYKQDRESWQPYAFENDSIRKLIENMGKVINFWLRENKSSELIRLKFVAEQFFNEDDLDSQGELWKELIDSGGIVIIDIVSLLHPEIREIFIQSHVSSHKNVALLGLTPMSISTLEATNLFLERIRYWMRNAFTRFSSDLDNTCDFGTSNMQAIERWLFNALPKTAKIDHKFITKATPINLIKIRKQFSAKSHGIYGAIAKGGFR